MLFLLYVLNLKKGNTLFLYHSALIIFIYIWPFLASGRVFRLKFQRILYVSNVLLDEHCHVVLNSH